MYSNITGASGKFRDAQNSADVTPTVGAQSPNGFYWTATGSAAATGINFQGQWTADADF
jgi:hypothetical protein